MNPDTPSARRARGTAKAGRDNADRARKRRPPLLVFIHIPKTAGTAVTNILDLNEPGDRSRHLVNVFKGGGGLKEGASFRRFRSQGSTASGVRLVRGHFPLGMRRHLPKRRDKRCFTFLRDPAERMLSHFYAVRGHEEIEPVERRDLPPLRADATLEEAVESGYLHDNLQTRMLSGVMEPFGKVTDKMLEQAKHNLREELVFFGLTERFDESMVLARRRLGLSTILPSNAANNGSGRPGKKSTGRVNTARPRGDQVPEGLASAAEAYNKYDIELYRYAETLFDEAPERDELAYAVELAAFRAATAEGGSDPEPPPEGYRGSEGEWRMLLEAKALLMRDQNELAEIRAVTHKLGRGDKEIQEELRRFEAKDRRQQKRGTRPPSRGPDSAIAAIEMLARIQTTAEDGADAENGADSTKRRRKSTRAASGVADDARSQGPRGGRRRRTGAAASARQPEDRATGRAKRRKRRKRRTRDPQDA